MTAQTHSLRANGAPFNEDGTWVNPNNRKTTSGSGRAACSCGETSPIFSSGSARRDWHKSHKLANATAPETASADFEEPAPAAAPEPAADPAEDLLGLLEEDPAAVKGLSFDEAPVAAMFFRHFGREGTKTFIAANYPTVSVKTKTNGSYITLTGPESDVHAAIAGLREMWAAAGEAVKVYVKTDPEFDARPRKGLEGRTASYNLKSRFLVNFAAEFTPTA